MSIMNGSRNGVCSEINVTPMIDVLLVLLIIFMVVLPHHFWGERADIPVPAEDVQAPQVPDPTIVIQLHDRGEHRAPSLTINQQEIAWNALENKLREVYLKRVEKVAFLKGDPEIDFQYVADALDTIHHAGVDRVGLMGAKD